ncbi:MAG: GTPase [Candidatus Freyarchaeota archaeon]|nr:GTPase [Candidatus Jordarchaeia archaeon]MBS7267723.1 GTPase [Candidatus Jordarchaeia archaeon]MBS7278874.1 GTPase [Candidatus Jordarchaeia archaeon]
MGAAGRDFHNFNVFFRQNDQYEVVAFTAAQIPKIENRVYPPELAGPLYPKGIKIYPEEELPNLIKKYDVDQVVLAYTDLSHITVMNKASLVLACGADFRLMGPKATMLKTKKPVISICAVRTGSGKSQTTRKVSDILRRKGLKVVVVRHPMPYGDLKNQVCQRFATYEDLDKYQTTIEEREEYEPHIDRGNIVYAGVDYRKILEEAEKEADIILWDGGNNDFPFYKPDLQIVLVDPHRPGHELTYYPGETNARMADIVIINKIDSAKPDHVEQTIKNIKKLNPKATVIKAASPITVENPDLIRDKRVLVVEDGPTLTHGGMSYGAGIVAARKYAAKEIVDPRPYAVGSIKKVFEEYPQIGALLPAMGYSPEQIDELKQTIEATDCDTVIIGTPIDLRRLLKVNKTTVRIKYELQEIGKPDLEEALENFLNSKY